MERESFENEETAKILNANFISVKVDREERPDIDEVYMQAAQILTGAGGWPLSVFLDTDLKPFYAGTYFPPEDGFGRPGFPRLLLGLAQAYHTRRDEVNRSSGDLTNAIQQTVARFASPGQVGWPQIESAAAHLVSEFDSVNGGFGSAPKFPPAMALQLLLREYQRKNSQDLLDAVLRTLDSMAKGGIFDHIGGGFHRYSTDEQWLVPHFEKMLYDNALMTTVYIEASQATGRTDFADTARRILQFVHRELTAPEGGYFSALDADSEGVEGKYYVWTPNEVAEVLGSEKYQVFCRVYGITERGNFENNTSIPHLSSELRDWAVLNGFEENDLASRLSIKRAKLLEARERKTRPHLDDKIIVGWNGLMIAAMAFAGRVLGDRRALTSAESAANFLLKNARINESLAHSWRAGQVSGFAYQDDYACLINGLVELYFASFNLRWLKEAERLADEMISIFWDSKEKGFFFTSNKHATPLARTKNPTDGVIPSGNSSAALGLEKLGRLLGRVDFNDYAKLTVASLGGLVEQAPRAFDNLFVASHFLLSVPQEIVFSGLRETDEFQEMQEHLRHVFLPNAIFAYAQPDNGVIAVTEGKSAGEQAVVYVCSNYACKSPAYTVGELAERL